MNLPLPSDTFLLLFGLVYAAGLVDSLAGGGGLITLPAYLAVGVPAGLVLGTNKCSSSIGTVVSVVRYWRKLDLSLSRALPMTVCALAGSYACSRIVLAVDPSFIRPMLMELLPFAAWSVLSKHRFGAKDDSASLGERGLLARSSAVAFPVGAYDGFFGPGTGTFLALGLSRFCRFDLLHATGYAKILNLASNVSALAAFLWAGKVDLKLGLSMGAASVLGHWTGSQLGLKKGPAAIKPAMALVIALLFLKLAYDSI